MDNTNLNKSQTRIEWVDIMRALLIISVVIGHSGSPWFFFIYTFHMPAFMILSGYTTDFDRYGIKDFVVKRILSLVIPAFLCNFIFILFYEIIDQCGWYGLMAEEAHYHFMDSLRELFTRFGVLGFGGATWFLIVLFEAELLFFLVDKITSCLRINWIKYFLVFVIAAYGLHLANTAVYLRYCFDLGMIACFYVALGNMIREYKVLDNIDLKYILPFSLLSSLFFTKIYFKGVVPMNWPTRLFADPFVQVWACITGTYIIYAIAISIRNDVLRRVLCFIGKRTYSVIILHFVIFRILMLVRIVLGMDEIEVLKNLTPTNEMSHGLGWVIITLVTVFACAGISWIAEKNAVLNYLVNARISVKGKN